MFQALVFLALIAYLGIELPIIAALLLLPAIYPVYLAAYSTFGNEVLVLKPGQIISERRLFGITTRQRVFDIGIIRSVDYKPTSFFEGGGGLALHAGFDEGSVRLCYDVGYSRVAEGLSRDDEGSRELAESLDGFIRSQSAYRPAKKA